MATRYNAKLCRNCGHHEKSHRWTGKGEPSICTRNDRDNRYEQCGCPNFEPDVKPTKRES
jgi:hypothetical protein